MTDERVIANSSSGSGLRVSIDHGKRIEDFINTNIYWYYASEIYLGGSYYSFELKNPELGGLYVYRKKWKGSSTDLVAAFPKGSWEFVRLLDSVSEGIENDSSSSESRNYCPQGCWVQGYRDLSEETKLAHMTANHKRK